MAMRPLIGLLTAVTVLAGCAGESREAGRTTQHPSAAVPPSVEPWPTPPASIPDGTLDPAVANGLDRLLDVHVAGGLDRGALDIVAGSADPRLAWIVADLLRLVMSSETEEALVEAARRLTGVTIGADERLGAVPWVALTNLLVAWDLPAPPGHREAKARIFLDLEPAWEPLFADADASLDWRLVSWGGVFIDDREVADGRLCARGCIPALDDPELTPAAAGDWYADERTVFGIVVDGEAVALPKHIMEVHEMVNLTVGGRRIGLPYCTLCGAAHAYLTDAVPEGVTTPVLRTSGLLSRSNKIMYDLETWSAFATFTGRAVSGPLHDIGLVLEPIPVSVTTWGDWKAAHPETRIVARDGGVGRDYPDDPLAGRDEGGPIFPVGLPDPRLPAHAEVLGVIGPDGRPVAVPVDHAVEALAAGRSVEIGDVRIVNDGPGLRAVKADGTALASQRAFWFAWSGFHPDTAVWVPPGE